jgi:hypothetical protein
MYEPYTSRIVVEHARVIWTTVLERCTHSKQDFGRDFRLPLRLPKSRDATHFFDLLLFLVEQLMLNRTIAGALD